MNDPRVPSISVVIPAFNEGHRIAATLEQVVGAFLDDCVEVLVVDDGSRDATVKIVEGLSAPEVRLLRLPSNRGKGAAIRTGLQASTGAWVLVCDADLSTPIQDLQRLLPLRDRYPVILGSRAMAASEVRRSRRRRVASAAFRWVLRNLGLCTGIRDTQCGFKLLHGRVARRLASEMEVDGFAWDVELIELARLHGIGIQEVGVCWTEARGSTVGIVRDGLAMVADALAVRRRMQSLSSSAPRNKEIQLGRPRNRS